MTAFVQILSLLMVVCGILLLWGCSTSSINAPRTEGKMTPTLITVGMPLPHVDPYLTPILPLNAPYTRLISYATEPPIILTSFSPTCYSQPQGGWVCLGRVFNNSLLQVKNTTLTVLFGNQKYVVTPEQHSISSGAFAPYRARFESRGVTPASAVINAYTLENALIPQMALSDEQGDYLAGRGYGIYRYSANVQVGDRNLVGARLTVTLLDEQQRVVAYRTHDLPSPLPAHSKTPVEVSLIPQAFAEQFSVMATLTLK